MQSKKHLTHEEQLDLLVSRGLSVPDTQVGMNTLRALNYYRLSAYAKAFMHSDQEYGEKFKDGVSLDDIRRLYAFDSDLRTLLFSALSEFETRVRASVAYHVGKQNPYMHLTGEGLANEFLKINELGNSEHSIWIADYEEKIRKMSKSELFVRWHIEKYEARLPIWAAVEVLDFGALSKLLRSVGQGLAHTIGDDFNLDPPALKSWVACMNELRNVVAHNGRIWNRSFVISPVTRIKNLPSDLGHLSSLGRPEKYKIYPRIEFLLWLQNQEILGQNFSNRLLDLLASFPESGHLSIAQMGFPLE